MDCRRYHFTKIFLSAAAAIEEITGISESLGRSDLVAFFYGCDTWDDFQRQACEWEREEYAPWSSYTLDYKCDGFIFSFETTSGINGITLDVRKVFGKTVVIATYAVESEFSLRSSSIAPLVMAAGWRVHDEDVDPVEQARLEKAEDLEHERLFREAVAGNHLFVAFSVNFDPVRVNGEVAFHSVSGHAVATNPRADLYGLELCPDLKSKVKAICDSELKRTFTCPDPYEYNEEIRQGGENSWYSKRFKEYLAALATISAACIC